MSTGVDLNEEIVAWIGSVGFIGRHPTGQARRLTGQSGDANFSPLSDPAEWARSAAEFMDHLAALEAGCVSAPNVLRLVYRRLLRQDELLPTSSSVLADRHCEPLGAVAAAAVAVAP